MTGTDAAILVLGADYWRSHPILLSLAFAAVMILSDRQDAGLSRQGDSWPLRMGVLLLAGFTVGAVIQRLWSSFLIGLVALYLDFHMLRRLPTPPSATAAKSWMPLTFGLSQWKKDQEQKEGPSPSTNPRQEREDR